MTLRKSIPVETTCLSIKFIWKSLQDALLITGIQQKVLKIYYQLFHYKGCLQSSWWLPFPRKQRPSSSFSFYILQNTCPAHFTEIGAVKRSILSYDSLCVLLLPGHLHIAPVGLKGKRHKQEAHLLAVLWITVFCLWFRSFVSFASIHETVLG